MSLPLEERVELRDALHARGDLIDQFVQENPSGFADDELEIVSSWKHALAGSFYIFRYLKRYTVFLSSEPVPRAYGVLALADPFEVLVGRHLPILTQAVLLPLKGRIIYDGLLSSYSISFGGGVKRMLNESDDFLVFTMKVTKTDEVILPSGVQNQTASFGVFHKDNDSWEILLNLAVSDYHIRETLRNVLTTADAYRDQQAQDESE